MFSLASNWKQSGDHSDLKVALMDNPDNPKVRARAAAHLGLALRAAREYVLDTETEAYGLYRLRWMVNLGLPSAGYDDGPIQRAFLRVARAAWVLSRRADPLILEIATQAVAEAESSKIEEDQDVAGVEVVPEIAALVVGYAWSRGRRDGLHVMIDVGASTIDICGFGLDAPDDDVRYVLNAALVERIGVQVLHQQRMTAIGAVRTRIRSHVPGRPDPFWPVPDSGRDYVEPTSRELGATLDDIDERWATGCTNALMKVLMYLKKEGDPLASHFQLGLPLFMAGGGARFGLVRRAVSDANGRLTKATYAAELQEEALPILETLDGGRDGIPGDAAVRLGVAYGLGFPKPDIGNIIPPGEVEPVPPMPPRPPEPMISKDQV